MTLIIISFLIITSYVGVMIYRKGIPYSISDTYYSLEHKVWFGFSMIATALLLMPSILDRTPENFQFLAFLMCAGICFVGVAPNFKGESSGGGIPCTCRHFYCRTVHGKEGTEYRTTAADGAAAAARTD